MYVIPRQQRQRANIVDVFLHLHTRVCTYAHFIYTITWPQTERRK